MNVKEELLKMTDDHSELFFNNIDLDPEKIRTIMVNEVVPPDPADDFYGCPEASYLTTTIPLFQKAGIPVSSIAELTNMGIYITNAVKTPKTASAIEKDKLEKSLPFLEKELSLFPNAKVIMLMGDVARKSFNMIAKKDSGKNAVPAVSTYKLRGNELYYRSIRIMPSYIMTGKNLLIEKSKFEMASEDIAVMLGLITGTLQD